MFRTRAAFTSLVGASHVALMVGSGTLANDAVGAQLNQLGGRGLVLANGEFGERLVDHARRWGLQFAAVRRPWGESFDWTELRRIALRLHPSWLWGVLTETSTGVANSLCELRGLSERVGAELCLDAVSAIGLSEVQLQGVRFATAVSGKGLAAFPGLAAVFHDGRLASSGRLPRYLDLSAYDAAKGVPYTHSSNLLAALECALLETDWQRKFQSVAEHSHWLRTELRGLTLSPLAREADSAAGIVTVKVPPEVRSTDMATELLEQGIEIAGQSGYLVDRNWLQIALMGETDTSALRALPDTLARAFEKLAQKSWRETRDIAPTRLVRRRHAI
jgi:aspartate aminotransferase-like enzyme